MIQNKLITDVLGICKTSYLSSTFGESFHLKPENITEIKVFIVD